NNAYAAEDPPPGAHTANLTIPHAASILELGAAQVRGRPRGSRAEVGHRHPELDETPIVGVSERFRDEMRRVQESPERIALPGKMMADGLGAQSWIDTDEEDLRARSQHVAQRHDRNGLERRLASRR